MSNEDNAAMLKAEFENLVQGEEFHESFEELALEYSTSLPCMSFILSHPYN
jgi:hypothetical protein